MSMTNSIIFYTRKSSGIINGFIHYDCCEHLGSNINDYEAREVYIAIPKKELHDFFKRESMIAEYCRFITDAFDIEFRLATPEEILTINWNGSKATANTCVVVKHTRRNNITNKHFNSAYNVLRYLWYDHYTNMAIIATNLYLLEVATPIDVLAIAHSFQNQGTRALLPTNTDKTGGILFFKDKKDLIKGLQNNTPFNSVFYKYPIYFNPVVEVSGSFFSDCKNTIAAKETFARLGDIDSIEDLPGFIRNNVKVIIDDYSLMKIAYERVSKQIDSMGLQLGFSTPLLLSRNMDQVPATFINPTGSAQIKLLSIAEDGTVKIENKPKNNVEAKKKAVPFPDVDFEEAEDGN